jgi:hypothetical protein
MPTAARGSFLVLKARRALALVAPLAVLVAVGVACLPTRGADGAPAPFRDDFERAELGPQYLKRGGSFRIEDGALRTLGDRNQPLWLDVPLARNVRIELTTVSRSPAVDTKIEVFGDGVRHESGYIVIVGGWKNTITTIARLDEHEPGRKELRRRFEPHRRYRWTVQRTDGKTLELFLDGERILAYEDADPLYGPKNNRLAFTSWESDVSYDDLVITPLP